VTTTSASGASGGPVAVAGIGRTEYSWRSGRTEAALATAAIDAALADAGLARGDVDGMVRFAIESTAPTELVARLGMPPLRFEAADAYGGGTACGLLGLADAAIRTGRARVVVAYRAFNARSQLRLGSAPPAVVYTDGPHTRAVGPSPAGEFGAPYGLGAPAHIFALWIRAYMHRHGITDDRMADALAAVVTTQRAAAATNPDALLHDKPLSRAAYDDEPMIVEPLRRADLCLESDGACAVVLTEPAVAAGCRSAPVQLLGASQAVIAGYQDMFLSEPELPPRPPPGAVGELLASCGLTIADVDVLGTYDACSAHVVFDVENVGLCAAGEGVDWVTDPAIPVNTSGGQLAEVYLQGMNHVVELVRRLRAGDGDGDGAGVRADVALATGQAVASAAVLARGGARGGAA
jgi:acetyl-CoA acetyltransferase